MMRRVLWVAGGILLGLIIHLVLMLVLPQFTRESTWARVSELNALGKVVVIAHPEDGNPNTLGLDPGMGYAICQFDLSRGPGVFNGELPNDFWSLGVFDKAGTALYGTTNRSGVGTSLALGIFNPSQMRLLAEQQFEIEEGLLIVEAPSDDIFAVVRLSHPVPEMLPRYEEELSQLACGHINIPDTLASE